MQYIFIYLLIFIISFVDIISESEYKWFVIARTHMLWTNRQYFPIIYTLQI